MNKKLFIIFFLLVGSFVLATPPAAQANVPHVDGQVRNAQTGAGIPNVWVGMHTNGCTDTSYCSPCNSGPGTRYALTDSQGRFRFDGLDISRGPSGDPRLGRMIDTNFDGSNDAQEIPLINGCISQKFGVPNYTNFFQCHGSPFDFFVVRPVGWGGTFSTAGGFELTNVPGETVIDLSALVYTPPAYAITGNVFRDTNLNGVKDAGEVNHQGATITRSGASSGSTTTDANGNYAFNALGSGTYTTSITVPNGYTNTTPISQNDVITNGNLTSNFGIVPLYTMSGTVFIDHNRNGGWDTEDSAYNKGTLTITRSGTSAGTTTTNATGGYSFSIPPGTYTVSTSIPTGFISSPTSSQTVNLAANNFAVNLGISPVYTINGSVFGDYNKNGIKDSGETNYAGTPSVTASRGTVTTNVNGTYSISNLIAGTVTISYTSLPSGYKMTYPLNGPPSSFQVTVGPGCNTNGSKGAFCE